MAFYLDEEIENVTNIKVVGVGGGGGNAVNRMVISGLKGVEFIAMNTDAQALKTSKATQKVQLGLKLTKGRGAGADPEIGQRAAEESKDEIARALKGCQMVFITAGMGGGTGTGAAPVVAEVAREQGILTVGIVTKPFAFEGKQKMVKAQNGINNLLKNVDSLIVIPNEKLKNVSEEKITFRNAFDIADSVLKQGVESISELINVPSFINLDFADVRTIMKDAGYAHMGIGKASGENRHIKAAEMAISSPLLETTIESAMGVIISFVVPADVGLDEVDEAASLITNNASEDANIIWGAAFDPSLTDEFKVTVVATGFTNMPTRNHDTREFKAIKEKVIGDRNRNWFDNETAEKNDDFGVLNWGTKPKTQSAPSSKPAEASPFEDLSTLLSKSSDTDGEDYFESIKSILRGNTEK